MNVRLLYFHEMICIFNFGGNVWNKIEKYYKQNWAGPENFDVCLIFRS